MAEQMAQQGAYIVVDIGKTLSKVTLWTRDGRMLDREVRPNASVDGDGIRRLDVDGIAGWLTQTLRKYAAHPIEAIVPVGHGAGFVALVDDGPAFTPIDYEQAIPDSVLDAYRAERDPFKTTGSPALPAGLNLGAQIYWAEQLYPEAMASAVLVPWAQFWAWWLSGVAVSEQTSLGCHTDLWSPDLARFSGMAQRLGWADRFPRLTRAGEVIGKLRPELASATGLPASAEVLAGIHDSNAALLAARGFNEIANAEATVLSTGTWFVAMRRPATRVSASQLHESRDTLINVDANGWPVPSGRFMGGREIEQIIEIDTRRVDIKPDQPRLLAAVPGLLASGAMLLPTLAPGCGPFPDGEAQWVDFPDDWYARRAAACLYAALVADATLDLIGSQDRLLVEGRFAEAEVFVRALAALRPDMHVMVANAHNDVSFGALRLINPLLEAAGGVRRVEPIAGDLGGYRDRWRARMETAA